MGFFKSLKYMFKIKEPYCEDDDCGGDD